MTTDRDMAVRIAARWARNKRVQKKKDKQGEGVSMRDFLAGPGKEISVRNPVTGQTVKLPSLSKYTDDSRVQKILQAELDKWHQSQAEPEPKADESKAEPDESKAEPEGSKAELLDIKPPDFKPPDEIVDFVGKASPEEAKNPVQRVVNKLRNGEQPTAEDVARSSALVSDAMGRGDLTDDESASLSGLDAFLKGLLGEKTEKDDKSTEWFSLPDADDYSKETKSALRKHKIDRDEFDLIREFVEAGEEPDADPEVEKARKKHGLEADDVANIAQYAAKARKSKDGDKDLRQRFLDDLDADEIDLRKSVEALSDEDFAALAKPPAKPKSVAQRKKEFAANAEDPDLAKRVAEMDNDDFEALMAAFGWKRGKRGSLRASLIRLAYAEPRLRRDLVPLVAR